MAQRHNTPTTATGEQTEPAQTQIATRGARVIGPRVRRIVFALTGMALAANVVAGCTSGDANAHGGPTGTSTSSTETGGTKGATEGPTDIRAGGEQVETPAPVETKTQNPNGGSIGETMPENEQQFTYTILAQGYTPDPEYATTFVAGSIPIQEGDWAGWTGSEGLAAVSCGADEGREQVVIGYRQSTPRVGDWRVNNTPYATLEGGLPKASDVC